ncbi:flagellar assembly protein FliX [Sneathiella glossodoripedis]|uniref:flagellar assembly protein FliX n=1 Tax=Sneathiella glossodoripedis TaxID=418853 RepID=UPI000A06BC23|nr:flagellar assembly protein FliX [Sneathiella glossodoripedis]
MSMRVSGPGNVNSTRKAKGGKSASKTGEKFSVPGETNEVATSSNVSSSAPIASIDAIVALQGVEDSVTSNKKAVSRGQDLLERLEEIRHGLLIGAIPVERLKQLQATLSKMDVKAEDPKLAEILGDIELRAAVELAKLGY